MPMRTKLSLANKCIVIFGAVIVIILTVALSVPWIRTSRMVQNYQLEGARQLADAWFDARIEFGSLGTSSTSDSSLDLRFLDIKDIDADQDRFAADSMRIFSEHPLMEDRYEGLYRDGEYAFRYARPIHRSELESIRHRELTDFGGGSVASGINDTVDGILLIDRTSDFAEQQLFVSRTWMIIAWVLATTLAMLVFYLILTKLIFSPVRKLRRVAERIEAGDLSARSALQTGDEFEELANAFNEMLDHMSEDREQLRRMNESLDLKLEELAEANVGLYESGRLKNEFLANVSHELRTPLNSIIGFAELLGGMADQDEYGELTAKRRRYIGNIMTSGQSLLDMINELLNMAKIEAGRMEVVPEPTSVNDLLEGLEGIMRPQAAAKGISLAVRIEGTLPTIETDPGKLQQILYNYLSNAIKFTPESGSVKISAERMVPASGVATVRIGVADNGPGVPEDMMDIVFEKFRQLDAGHTREHQGTGLGLAICRELADLLHAGVSVESTPGEGATFFVDIPVVFASEEPGPLMPA